MGYPETCILMSTPLIPSQNQDHMTNIAPTSLSSLSQLPAHEKHYNKKP